MLTFDIAHEVRAAVRDLLPELRTGLAQAVRDAMAERLLTVSEAAEVAGATPAALRKRIARGHLSVQRSGRSVRVRLSDLLSKPEVADDRRA